MTTQDPREPVNRAEARELSLISQGAHALTELTERIAPRFQRAEVRNRVGRYLRGL